VSGNRAPGEHRAEGRDGTEDDTALAKSSHRIEIGAHEGHDGGHPLEGLTNEPRPAPSPGLSVRLALINGNSADAARARPRGARGRSARRRREERRALEERSGMQLPDGADPRAQ